MRSSDELCVVSVQRPGGSDPRKAHLGPGLLIGPSLLLVPAATLLAAPARFDVLIGPTPGGSGPVERHAAHPFPDGRVSIVRLMGHEERIAVGHAQLAGSSSSYRGRDARLDLLMKSLAKQPVSARVKPGGPWGWLSPMVPEEIRELPDADWLAGVREWIQPTRPPVELVLPPEVFPPFLCRLSPWWDPGEGPAGGPDEPGNVAPRAG